MMIDNMSESYNPNRSCPDLRNDSGETLREYKNMISSLETRLQSAENEIQNLLLENGTLKKQLDEKEQTIKNLTIICTSPGKTQKTIKKRKNPMKNDQNQTKIEVYEDNKQERPLDEHNSSSESTSSPDLQPKLQTTKEDPSATGDTILEADTTLDTSECLVDFYSAGTCAVCEKEIEAGKWIQHIQKDHGYLAWRKGEPVWDLDDFTQVNKYLYEITKKMGGLTCNKCGVVRKYVKSYLTHIKSCDVVDFNLTSIIPDGVGPVSDKTYRCAMCQKEIEPSNWKNHAMKEHYNITWVIGETPIDIKNPYAVEKYLKEYQQSNSLKCNNCGATRASFAGFYAHIITCGKTEEQIEMFQSVCDICKNKYLCIYKNQHMMIHKVQSYNKELKMSKEKVESDSFGHAAKSCREATYTCGHCGVLGHSIKECPKKDVQPKCASRWRFKKPSNHSTGAADCPAKIISEKRARTAIETYSSDMSQSPSEMDVNMCHYIGCGNTSKDTAMFRYPVDDWKRLNKWLLHSGHLSFTTAEEFNNKFICSKHFQASKLRRDSCGAPGLVDGAVPCHYMMGGANSDEEQDAFRLKKPARVYEKKKTYAAKKRKIVCQRDTESNSETSSNIHLLQGTVEKENHGENDNVYNIVANVMVTDSKNNNSKNINRHADIEIKKEIEEEQELDETAKLDASTDLQIKIETKAEPDIKIENDLQTKNLKVESDIPFASNKSCSEDSICNESNDVEKIYFEEIVIKEEHSMDVEESDVLHKRTDAISEDVLDIKKEWAKTDPEVKCDDPGVECSSASIECDSAVNGCSDTFNTEPRAVQFLNDVIDNDNFNKGFC